MPSAEIITIGTEILLGDINDTNSKQIAKYLKDIGVDLYRVTTVGDNITRIKNIVQEAIRRCEIIITTGGLGPTVDDPTREAIAQALELDLEYHPELWQQILERFKQLNRQPTINNHRQAFIPQNATPMNNPVGTAPAFICHKEGSVIISIPGVPMEMDYLMHNQVVPYIQNNFHIDQVIFSRVLHTIGAGESKIDNLIKDFERMSNPTVGLVAHFGQVDIRITAKAKNKQAAYEMIKPIEKELRQLIGKWIYGTDGDTLESVSLDKLYKLNQKLFVLEAGLKGYINHELGKFGAPYQGGLVLQTPPTKEMLPFFVRQLQQEQETDITIGISNYQHADKSDLLFFLVTPHGEEQIEKSYAGPPTYVQKWALHNTLEIFRGL